MIYVLTFGGYAPDWLGRNSHSEKIKVASIGLSKQTEHWKLLTSFLQWCLQVKTILFLFCRHALLNELSCLKGAIRNTIKDKASLLKFFSAYLIYEE